ncbi:ABC transporter ATP-binding protein [Ramlibacter sp. AN1133]|uniref:ABC transporter ATP-binding protein n=1 Tax=Ramlibacter sp. AN1133 TaxID=3133429 RepID=UPI0030C464F3
MKLLQASGISLAFKGVRALDNVDLAIDQGELVGIIGPNGSGKSTLFNVLSGIYRCDAGTIHLDGAPIGGLAPSRIAQRGLVRTFQNKRLFGSMSVLENVLVAALKSQAGSPLGDVFGLTRSKQGMSRGLELARRCLDRVNLSSLAAVQARDLPYGAQNRLEIARALALEPRLLLLDEPAAGLNPAERGELRGLIEKVHSDGVTIVLVEHDVRMVTGLCRRVLALDHGVKIADGPSEEVVNNPQVLEAYFGDVQSEEASHA